MLLESGEEEIQEKEGRKEERRWRETKQKLDRMDEK
jgi:hypothetical protein